LDESTVMKIKIIIIIPCLIILFFLVVSFLDFFVSMPIENMLDEIDSYAISRVRDSENNELLEISAEMRHLINLIVTDSVSSNNVPTRGELHPFYYFYFENGISIKIKLDSSRDRIYTTVYGKRGNSKIYNVLYDCENIIEMISNEWNQLIK
jgi:hypothetical protein